jgi:hypothetical protein
LKKLTKDHVPPKLLLEQPFPLNVLTVPCCYDCNQLFQEQDKYARTVLAMDLRASKNAAAQYNLPAIMRSLQKPEAKAFADHLLRQTIDTIVLGADGKPMAQSISVDQARIDTTGRRLVRGLFYVEAGRPLAVDARVRVASKPNPTPHDPVVAEFVRFYSRIPERRDRAIGTAFSYVAGFGDLISVWMMLLYDYYVWVGIVDERPIAPASVMTP